jgi:hypothetical protein
MERKAAKVFSAAALAVTAVLALAGCFTAGRFPGGEGPAGREARPASFEETGPGGAARGFRGGANAGGGTAPGGISPTGPGYRPGAEPARWYVAPARIGGNDRNGGETAAEPLATAGVALARIEARGTPAEIVILGEIGEAVTIGGGCPPVVLRGGLSAEPGILAGTVTVSAGAEVTLGSRLTVSAGSGRGVTVSGGNLTLDGGIIAGNSSGGPGAGVYLEGGHFTMKDGAIWGNTASGGGAVYVGKGTFAMSGGAIAGNTASGGAGGAVYVDEGVFSMSGGIIAGNASTAAGGLTGISGGGVYVRADKGAVFKKTGGFIGGNTVPQGYSGSQVFVHTGGTGKARNSPAGGGSGLDSGTGDNWEAGDGGARGGKNGGKYISTGGEGADDRGAAL